MRRLMLLRHAKADRPEGVSDHDRPLTMHGHKQSKEMGKYMAKQGLMPELAVVSTARRTRETWQLVQPAFVGEIALRDDARIYEASEDDIFRVITETDPLVRILLLVGHNPGFEQLAGSLVGTGRPAALARLQREFPTAGLAVIDFAVDDWAALSKHGGHLERLETLASISN